METTRPGSDFWIYTSGFGFTREHAFKLKASGLTGIIVSIDHLIRSSMIDSEDIRELLKVQLKRVFRQKQQDWWFLWRFVPT
ncbi:MAG: hypothetical protein R3B93_17980 [Bacteroidia bacterium]